MSPVFDRRMSGVIVSDSGFMDSELMMDYIDWLLDLILEQINAYSFLTITTLTKLPNLFNMLVAIIFNRF